jgi:hypothetical protein
VDRFPEVVPAAAWIKGNVQPGDRVCVTNPWDAPMTFQLACDKMDRHVLEGEPAPERHVYVLAGAGRGQTPEGVVANSGLRTPLEGKPRMVTSWHRLELFQAR